VRDADRSRQAFAESARFWDAVHRNYHVETTIAGMTLYRANDA
jgi:hypothetical protein